MNRSIKVNLILDEADNIILPTKFNTRNAKCTASKLTTQNVT